MRLQRRGRFKRNKPKTATNSTTTTTAAATTTAFTTNASNNLPTSSPAKAPPYNQFPTPTNDIYNERLLTLCLALNLDTTTDSYHPTNNNKEIKNKAEPATPTPNTYNTYHADSAGDTSDTSDTTTNDYYSEYDSSTEDSDSSTDDGTTTTSNTDSDDDTDTAECKDNHDDHECDASSEEEPSNESPTQHQHPVNRTSKNTTQTTRNEVMSKLNRAPTRKRLGRSCKRKDDYSEYF